MKAVCGLDVHKDMKKNYYSQKFFVIQKYFLTLHCIYSFLWNIILQNGYNLVNN